jgi:PilZ domain
MEHERRGTTRYNFGAIAEVVDLDGSGQVVSLTRDLSFSGVFVTTTIPLPTGTRLRVRITHSGADFSAIGNVTGNVTPTGMGIVFTEIAASDRAILEKWLEGRS